MLIPALNLIFIHSMKTGGSSISDALIARFPTSAEKVRTREYQDMTHLFEIRDTLGFSKHTALHRYARALGATRFSEFDAVTVYRNPVYRLLSAHFCPSVRKSEDVKFSAYGLYKLVRRRSSLFRYLKSRGDEASPKSIRVMNFACLDLAANNIGDEVPGFPTDLPRLNPSKRPGYERNWLFLAIAFLMVVTSHHVWDFFLSPGRSATRKLGRIRLRLLGYRT